MHRFTSLTRVLAPTGTPAFRVVPARFLSTRPPLLYKNKNDQGLNPTKDPDSESVTQGHAVDKANETGHTDGDVQSASIRAGQDAKADAGGSGEGQAFDAARQGGQGGESKKSKTQFDSGATKEQEGGMKDQIGGQDQEGTGVAYGKTETAADGSVKDTIKNTIQGGFDSLKQLRSEKKNFHTSARAAFPGATSPSADVPGSREPKETTHGEQSEHIKHSAPETPDQGKGNAADEPHLPSKGGSDGQKRGLHTSAIRRAWSPPGGYAKAHTSEPNEAGFNAPPEALPAKLDSAYGDSAVQSPDPGQTPSSKVEFSSTAVDPPNDALRQAAKEGTLGDRNPQPHSEAGRQGVDEAWKHRK